MPYAMTADRALTGKTVAVTRPRASAVGLASALADAGAQLLPWPVFDIELENDSKTALARALSEAQWIGFTSANAVDAFVELATPNAMRSASIASIGPATTDAIVGYGARVDVTATTYTSGGLIEALSGSGAFRVGCNVLYPRAEDAGDDIDKGLSELGARVISVITYRKVSAANAIMIDSIPDAVIFASGSAARHLDTLATPARMLTRLKEKTIAACIGPSTAAVVTGLGYQNILTAEIHTVGGIVAALIAFFQHRNEEQ